MHSREKIEEKEMPLEEMVARLLRLKINLDFHIEALKAQAVVIRTNLLKSSNYLGGKGLKDIWDKNNEDEEGKKIKKAVMETEGIVMTIKGKPIDAKYHIACGGSTENAENVIDNQVAYLRRVLCDYCKDSPYWKSEKYYSIEEIEDLLKVKFPMENVDLNLEISGFMEEIERDQYGRVVSIVIGNKRYSGPELMEILELDSTRFSIFPTRVKFISRGKGDGLGLCQYGADTMAQSGYSFMDILKYYYTGVEIIKFPFPCIKRPLYGKKIVIDPGHGGEDEGYKGSYLGLLEKDISLNISLRLKDKLEGLGAKVYMTRDKDENVLAANRLEKANNIKPDFFISIHMDYFPGSKIKGVEMFHFRNDYESKRLGSHIFKNLKEEKIPISGVKEGNFYIFRGISSSSLLIEAGYLSNSEEEVKFKEEDYIIKLVNGIKKGILEFFES